MMSFTSRICSNPFRNLNQGICSIGFNNFGCSRSYSKDKGQCCKEVAQTEGRRVEPWPKSDPPPPNWQGCCPKEPQPPNYDPYRIKVPDVVVPPLPASNAKWTGVMWTTQRDPQHGQNVTEEPYQTGFPQHTHHQQHEQNEQQEMEAKEEEESTGFFGYLKNLFGRGRKGKGEGEMSMTGEQNIHWCYAH
ncbi:unnamed protein product [Pieris brassicae]|uniref:Uncharacterized protein n=1 Tax=Pieris brassicae TaxID=7116 RepID=A0A9P0T9E1_PIEBR|nr:unnamed protein product [Pieris brassicae]